MEIVLFDYKRTTYLHGEGFSDFFDISKNFMGPINTVPSLPSSLFLLAIRISPLCFLVSEKEGLVNQSVSHSLISFMAKCQQHAYVYTSV